MRSRPSRPAFRAQAKRSPDVDDPVAVALAFAGRQLARLRAGDFEGFEEAESTYLEACAAVTALPVPGPGPARLADVVADIAAELARMRAETGVAMTRLRATKTVTGAYLDVPSGGASSARSA